MKNGIDTSKNNGTINWVAMQSAKPVIDFVYIKLSEGIGYTDPKAGTNAWAAHNASFPVGYYHFASLNSKDVVNDATAEANYVIKALKNMPVASVPFALDIEREQIDLSKQEFLLWIKTFFSVIEGAGIKDYCIYSGKYFLNDNLEEGHDIGHIRLWIAQYTTNIAPSLPHGWDSYYIWQYTDKGKVPGIGSAVDLNKML